MSRRIVVQDEARFDLVEAAYEIAEDSLEAAIRFADAVNAAYMQLADTPGMGVRRDYGNPKLVGMRMWSVPGFRKYLIFYQADEQELRVLRVLHGAQDIENLFQPEKNGV